MNPYHFSQLAQSHTDQLVDEARRNRLASAGRHEQVAATRKRQRPSLRPMLARVLQMLAA